MPEAVGFGPMLRRWRRQRAWSQEALAHAAAVSTRHLSWLESGRSEPSRAMVLRLADRLQVPLRERNAWLLAAGYAPMFGGGAPDDAAAARVRDAVQRLLDAHQPWPALALDRHWNLVAHNRAVTPLLQGVAPDLLQPPVNLLRVLLDARGLASQVEDLPRWRTHLRERVARQLAATGDTALLPLLDALGPAPPAAADAEPALDGIAERVVLHTPHGRLAFITTITVFGAPHDLRLAELAIETLLPADEATAATLRRLDAGAAGDRA